MPSNVYNSNWFSGNLVRKYPLDSMASCVDDAGNYLLDDIITDINISFPRSLGEYCYVSSVNITAKLVSILISCNGIPIAACCVQRPTYIDRYYTLDSLHDGVAGVIAIGLDSLAVTGKWKFSDGASSRILPTCCTVYDPPAVLSISRTDDSTPMTGDILLTAGNDIELTTKNITILKEPGSVATKEVKAIFIGLRLNSQVLKEYITACEKATEADTCDRTYISVFGGASPECDGNINIVSRTDTIHIEPLLDGVLVLSSDFTLPDMCPELHKHKFGELDESDSSSSASQSQQLSYDTCPFPGPNSPNICDSPSRLAKNSNSDEVSPLITRSTTLDLSLNYVNLYTSDIEILSGGAEYGDGLGLINIAPDDLSFKTAVFPENKVDLLFRAVSFDAYTAVVTYAGNVLTIKNNLITLNGGPIGQNWGTYEAFHVVFFNEKLQFLDEGYNLLFEQILQNSLSNEIFVTINGIKCETIAYE